MKTLRFYILKEFWPLFFLSFIVFTSILLLGEMLELIEITAKGGRAVWRLIAYIPLFSLPYSLPMAILAATMLSLGRLAQDNEVTAAKASGIKVFSLLLPLFLVGFLFSLLSFHLNNAVIPRAEYHFEVLSEELGRKKPALLFREKVFIKDFTGHRLFLEKVEGSLLQGVHIWQLREEGPPLTIFARRGEVIPDPAKRMITLKLIEGMRTEIDPGAPGEYSRTDFSVYYFNIPLPEVRIRRKSRDEMTIQELREEIKKLSGLKVYPLLVEINRRFSLSFAGLTFVLIGAPLGVMVKKGGKSRGFGLTFLLILLYYAMMMLGESLGEKGTLPPALAMWAPTVFLSSVGLFLIIRRIEY
ncbi:LptF/LptG family permease [candidate division NPL-UPA2 bacterium]|nr:LptF/LptG family permease [candidate division NPL-UPA2 bacterium]